MRIAQPLRERVRRKISAGFVEFVQCHCLVFRCLGVRRKPHVFILCVILLALHSQKTLVSKMNPKSTHLLSLQGPFRQKNMQTSAHRFCPPCPQPRVCAAMRSVYLSVRDYLQPALCKHSPGRWKFALVPGRGGESYSGSAARSYGDNVSLP